MPPVLESSGLQQTTRCTPQQPGSLRPSGGSTCGRFRPRGPANHNTTQSARPVIWDGPISAFPFPASYVLSLHPSLSYFQHQAKCKPVHIKTGLIPRASASIRMSVCDTWQSRCRAVTHRRRRAPSWRGWWINEAFFWMANVQGQEQECRRTSVVSFLSSAALSFLTFLPERPINTDTRERGNEISG